MEKNNEVGQEIWRECQGVRKQLAELYGGVD